MAWIQANLPSDAVVVDAGGNIGLTALLMATLLPEGHVHVFEALSGNAEHLCYNIRRNGIRNCTVNAVALGAESGAIVMQGSGSSAHVAVEGSSGRTLLGAVPMTTLDDYACTGGLKRVDFIKMDVEGFEPAVLEGGRDLVERFAPSILMEFNTWCLTFIQGYNARDFASCLWDSFEVTSVDASGAERPAGEGSAARFLHDNVVLHGTIEDVLLRLRPGATVPRRVAVVPPLPKHADEVELERLRIELEAMRRSTSWKVTAPLRAWVSASGRFIPQAEPGLVRRCWVQLLRSAEATTQPLCRVATTCREENGIHFATAGNTRSAAADIRLAMDQGEPFHAHAFDFACARNHIDQSLTKPNILGPPGRSNA